MFRRKQQPIVPRKPPAFQQRPKKGKCKITFKKKGDEEIMEFTPECKPEHLEMAKQRRAEQRAMED